MLNFIHNPVMGWVIFGCSIALTFVAYLIANNLAQAQARQRFDFRSEEIATAIQERLGIYEQALRSGVALWYSSDGVSRKEWRTFVESIEIRTYWPGIQGLGFAVPVSADEKSTHEESIRAEGFPDYSIKPAGCLPAAWLSPETLNPEP